MSSQPEQARTRLGRLGEFLAQDPRNLNLLAEVADLNLALGQFETARATIARALSVSLVDPYFRSRLASVCLGEQKWDEAIEICRGLLDEGHDDLAIRYNLGRGLMFAGRYVDARVELEALIGREGVPRDVAQLLIRALHHLGEVDSAIAVAERHLAESPDDAAVAGMLSLLYVDAGDLVSAKRWADRSLAKQARNLDALLAAGTVQLAAEEDENAAATFGAALGVNAESGRAWSGSALAKLMKLDLAGGRADFEQAVRFMPTHIGTWHGLAWVQLLQGDMAAAEASFRRAFDLDRNFSESHGGLAVVAASKGNWTEAEELVKTALRLDPQSFSARYARSLLLQRSGRGEAAQQLIQRALRGHPVPGGGTLADMLLRVTARRPRS